MTGRVASKLTTNSQCTHWVSVPLPPVILALDELLPHRSRIRDLSIVLYSSDPDWVDEDDRDQHGELTLLHHHFFRKALPNLQRLEFRAAHTESSRYMIPTPGSLFAAGLPRLKELKYVGASGCHERKFCSPRFHKLVKAFAT